MNKRLLLTFFFLTSIVGYGQIMKRAELFTTVPTMEGKVVFLKEIPQKTGFSVEENYELIKDWAKKNYGKDPFMSSLRYDAKNFEIIVKSRVELLLPPNAKGAREKMIMRYRINAFLFQGKCVLEITDLVYMHDNPRGEIVLPKTIKAESFITNESIEIKGELQELKTNTRKSTIYFINEVNKEFESRY